MNISFATRGTHDTHAQTAHVFLREALQQLHWEMCRRLVV